jgi:hypothetical protein
MADIISPVNGFAVAFIFPEDDIVFGKIINHIRA